MELILKNVKKKDLPVLKSLAKSLAFEIIIKEDKLSDPDQKNSEAKTIPEKKEKIKEIIREINEQWE